MTEQLELRGNNGSIRLDEGVVVVTNALFNDEKKIPYASVRSVVLTEPTWLMQGNLRVVTTAQAVTEMIGSRRARARSSTDVMAWQVNVKKEHLPRARQLKIELERRAALARASQ